MKKENSIKSFLFDLYYKCQMYSFFYTYIDYKKPQRKKPTANILEREAKLNPRIEIRPPSPGWNLSN